MGKTLTNNQILLQEVIKQSLKDSGYASESEYFEFFATSLALQDYDLSDEEVARGLVGGGSDGGCDGAYLFLNHQLVNEDGVDDTKIPSELSLKVVIVQTKKEFSFAEAPILKWKTLVDNLLNFDTDYSSFSKRYAEKVLSFFQCFKDLRIKTLRKKVKIEFEFYYITLATDCHPNVEAQAAELKQKVRGFFPNSSVDVKFVGADLLMEKWNSPSQKRFDLTLADAPISLGNQKDYIALVNLATYYRFITDEQGELRKYLFESNVRDYQGHNRVNKLIKNTLENPNGEEFWWLNNGVTILAQDASLSTTKSLLLTDPEIVNGLQTSNELFSFYTENKAALDTEKRNILIRVIVPANENSRDKIILATNSQTAIPLNALRATDPIHLQIEMYFKSRGFFYDRRKNYYKNRGKKSSEIISVGFLAQCLMSVLSHKPNFARARPSTLLSQGSFYDEMYVDNTDLDIFYKAAVLGKKVDLWLKKENSFSSSEKSDLLFYIIYFVAAREVQSPNITFKQFKDMDIELISADKMKSAAEIVRTQYNNLGGNATVAKGSQLISYLIDNFASLTE